jgi:serine/threonine protein kinase/pSer/pThr/pTyr-binding forkhead associated (FHA) protein
MSQQDHKDFFISYNRADQRWAEWIAWQLEEANYSIILQAWDFLPGSNFVVQMDHALRIAPRMIAVLSPQYLSSLYTQPEWAAAFRNDPKGEQSLLIPVRVQPCEVTGLLGPIVYVDLVGRDESAARQRLLAAVRHERAKPSQAPAFPQDTQHTVSKQLNFPGDVPPIWKMPHERDPLFLGREQSLQELHTSLATVHHVLLFETGQEHEAGSTGASATAVEYAYRYRSDYQVICWIQADSREALQSDLLELASTLHLPQAKPADQEPLKAIVQWLRNHEHWLLVLNGVHTTEIVSPLMPLPQQGHCLIVTATRTLETIAPLIELKQVPLEEQTIMAQLSQVMGAELQVPEGRIPLGLEPITIGRASTNQIVLRDPSVSSHHAQITLKDQAYWITDTQSTNGTLLNEQRLVPQVPARLHPGDAIRFGNITCIYGVLDRPSRSFASSLTSEQEKTSAGASPLSPPQIERHQPDRIGQRFGNYRLSKFLGQGGFAEVYLGDHIYLDTQTAIKVLHTQLVGQDVEQFRQEARTIAHLEHPHIVRLLDFGVEGTSPYLIMSYAPNGTMRERYPKGTRLPLQQIISYVKQISEALQYAHDRKIIHRDIKPENMLFGQDDQVVITDFGIALVSQSSRYQQPNDMAGTIAYMAPEQIEAHPRPASDQYSLGIVVYEWLCGERPFHGSFTEIAVKHQLVAPASLCEKVPGLSVDVEQVVMTALAKDPKNRFGSARAFATALEQARMVVHDASSDQLDKMESPSIQSASLVSAAGIEQTAASSLSEIEQAEPQLETPEPLQGNEEVPSQIHSDIPPPPKDGTEPEPAPLSEEIQVGSSHEIAALTTESAPLDAEVAPDEPPQSPTNTSDSSVPIGAGVPTSSPLSPPEINLILDSPNSQAPASDSLDARRSGTEPNTTGAYNATVNPWVLEKRQIIAMAIGIVLYSMLVYFVDGPLAVNYHGSYTLFNSLSGSLYLSWANILLGLIVVVPFFFATKFGPWVGLACFLFGALIGDAFSGATTNFPLSWYDFAGQALLGFLSGLAFLRTLGRYDTRRNLATAVATSLIAGLAYLLFFLIIDLIVYQSSWFDYFNFRIATFLVASIITLIFLPVLLLIANKFDEFSS